MTVSACVRRTVPEERLLPAMEPLHPGPDVDGPEPALPRHLQARLRVQPRRRVGALRQAGEVVRVRVPAFAVFRAIRMIAVGGGHQCRSTVPKRMQAWYERS